MSRIQVPMDQIKGLPALLGEVDVLKTLQLLPGVQSGSEGASGLYVRGGGPDQNLILLDGVPLYNVSHLFGFFSVFNADAINKVELTKGGFPARYGGRLSSVVDITMKEGNAIKLSGAGSVGLLATKLTLEGPIIKDKTSFIVSARRTYIDVLAAPIIKSQTDGNTNAGYYFYDINAKINHQFSKKDRIFLSGYLGKDQGYFKNKNTSIGPNGPINYVNNIRLGWGNALAAVRWNHVINKKMFSNLSLNYSQYRFDIYNAFEEKPSMSPTIEQKSRYLSDIQDINAKLDVDFFPNPNHYIRFGVSATRHDFRPGIYQYTSTIESDTTLGAEPVHAYEISSYIEDDLKISEKLKVNVGLHASGYAVQDTFYFSLQPRISARYKVNQALSAKASYAKMQQNIHLLTNAGLGLPTDLWVSSTKNIAPQQAWQLAAGLAYNWKYGIEFSLEGYYKEMDRLIDYKPGASFLILDKPWESQVAVGRGESYGVELFAQKKLGSLTGWVGYTLSWSNRQFDELNFGKKFPYKYDRRHDMAIALVKNWYDKIDLSATWVYGTGNAITIPIQEYPYFADNNNAQLNQYRTIDYYGDRNSYRMRSYHRLDVSISFKKKKKWGERAWTIGVYNLYNRKNPFFIDSYNKLDGTRSFQQYSLFPILPSISYQFKF